MRNAFIATILSCAGICAANAQSSVTLYGRVSSGLDFVSNVAQADGSAKNNFRFGSNQFGISWWGLKGAEDLGGGLKAVFNLESMFTAGTGQLPGDSLFNRYAYVGIASDKLGSVWLGRAMALTDETGFYLDPLGEQAIGIANFAKGRAYGSRANLITYNSLSYGGFDFRGQYGLGGQAGNFRGGRTTSASVNWNGAAFNVRGVYEEIRDANGKFSDPYTASREYMVGGTYTWEQLKFYVGYQELVSSGSDTGVSADNPTGATRNQQEWVGANWQVTPALLLQAGVFHANVNNGGGSGTLGVVGANYNLSKRTLFYATYGAMFNGGSAAFPVETADQLPLAGHHQQGGYIGVMHYF
jgi:predicted porin